MNHKIQEMYKRIEDEYDGCLFHGYHLTELMLLKKGKGKMVSIVIRHLPSY